MNQDTQWHHLIVGRLKDGGIHLEQQSGLIEPSVIHLHPEQLLFIARQYCGMKQETASTVAELERRISVLTDKIEDFVCDAQNRTDIIEHIPDGLWMIEKLDAMADLALEFDGGRLKPKYKDTGQPLAASPSPQERDRSGVQLELVV